MVKGTLEDVKSDEHPFGGQEIDASALGWAMSAVSSRAFRLYGSKRQDGTRENVPMLLPLIDMCNHNFEANAKIVQEKDAGDEKMLVKVCCASNSVKLTIKDTCVYLVISLLCSIGDRWITD